MAPMEQRYKEIGYADHSKPAITSMAEFTLVDKALTLFEDASGCKVHRDPRNMKCKFLPLGRWRNNLQQEDIPCNYMTLSDHLDMVGVTLKCSWTKTRKTNGDEIQKRVENTIRPWKGGKFMPITQRGWSINSYALSKVWFRTKCVDLRVCDIANITKSCKSWLYQDTLIKPEEFVIHRPHQYGGLGLHHVKQKALAGYITTFLQTAANPAFCRNLLHSLLYRKHILGEDVPGAPDPPPPYFSQEFFSVIRRTKEETPLNIIKMTEKDWVRLLTEEYVTMTNNANTGHQQFLPCRAELASPDTDWSLAWAACRQPGIPPVLASFLWRLMHNLLPTQAKLHRMNTIRSSVCKMPGCTEIGSLDHELLLCSKNNGVGLKLISCLQQHIPGLVAEDVLRLDHGSAQEDMSLPITLLSAVILSTIWTERESNQPIRQFKIRAELEQSINLLRTTRFVNAITVLEDMSRYMFQ